MSAVDFAARALALKATAQIPQTFVDLAQAALPATVTTIESAGHTVPGTGLARYVSDSLATAALAAAHPLAVFAGTGGRYFRLVGDADGFITPERLGCPVYTPGTNQQPWIQAAINYAKAAGLKGVKLPQERYELWCPARTAANYDDYMNHTGNFIVIDGWACALIGTHPNRSTLWCKGLTGGSQLTDYVTYTSTGWGADVIWRGNGIKLTGMVNSGSARPDDSQLSHLMVKDVVLLSDAVGVRNANWPALGRTRDPSGARENCWDINNKGVYCQQNVHTGNIQAENFDIIGFLGEAFYLPDKYTSRHTFRNVTVKHTNGQALNANGSLVFDVDGFYAENCTFMIEGWGGLEDSRVVNAHFKDCGGGAFGAGGAAGNMLRADNSMPVTVVDITLENCGSFSPGSNLQGRLIAIDTNVALVPANAGVVIRNVDLDVVHVVNKAMPISRLPLRYSGSTGGALQVSDTVIRLNVVRTKYAVDNAITVNNLVSQAGSLGPNNVLYVKGHVGGIGSVTTVTDNYIAIIDAGMVPFTNLSSVPFDPSTTASPDMGTSWLRGATFSVGNGAYSVNLPAVTMYPANAEIMIEHTDGAKQSCFMEAQDGTTKKVLVGYGDKARFRCNKVMGRWDLIFAPPPRKATASIALTSTALSAESGPYIVPLVGCRPWHRADVTPPTLMTGFGISAVRAETDQVKFWVRNYDGANPATLAAQTYTARCWLPPA